MPKPLRRSRPLWPWILAFAAGAAIVAWLDGDRGAGPLAESIAAVLALAAVTLPVALLERARKRARKP